MLSGYLPSISSCCVIPAILYVLGKYQTFKHPHKISQCCVRTKNRHACNGSVPIRMGVGISTVSRRLLTSYPSYYGAIIPSILNVFTLQSFLVLNCIIGGQSIASLSPHLNDTLGIVIIAIISLVVSPYAFDLRSHFIYYA